jgi:hypothetical protein
MLAAVIAAIRASFEMVVIGFSPVYQANKDHLVARC